MAKPIISADKIEITYNLGKQNEFKANRGTSLDVFDQEYIILFGPSGCGKSTLLYCMFGVLPPSAGKMYVRGESIYDFDPVQMVNFQRKTMGIMYQSFNLINSISVLDNVALPLIFAEIPAAERFERAMELCRRFMVDHVAGKRPTLLSGGQQQRVSAARSLVNDPDILIADEPVGNLDSITAAQVMDTLEQINNRDKKTVMLVTHDAKYLPYAHRVVYMNDGRIERIVPNPEKKQIVKVEAGTTIITEIEQIARIYPYDSPQELRVKSLTNYLTQSLSFDQLQRLERVIQRLIDGRLGEDIFLRILMDEYDKGGIGVSVSVAKEMADKANKILSHAQDVVRYRKATSVGTTSIPNREYIERIGAFVTEEMQLDLSPIARAHFEESIQVRVGGFIKKEEFKQQMMLDVDAGGAGLSKKATHETARLLEKLIAQGVMHVGAGHH